MSKTYICDTNVVLRYVLADDLGQFEKAKEIFELVKEGKAKMLLNTHVLTEIIYVLKSYYEVPKVEICDMLRELCCYKGIICEKEIVLNALKYFAETNLHIVDCLLLAQTQIDNYELLSFDAQLVKLSNKIG